MKTFVFALILMLVKAASACTLETIGSIVKNIDPYYGGTVASATQTALETLSLCDENLYNAGYQLGRKFNPYYGNSTARMAEVLIDSAQSMQADFIRGLGIGIVREVDLYYLNSSYRMFQVLLAIAAKAPEQAKSMALALLQKQDPSQRKANAYLLDTVKSLNSLAQQNREQSPVPVGSSIWAFKSRTSTCEGINESWGYYELCPRYFASVSDQYGNRLVLTCGSENYGIEFRVTLGQQAWARLSSTHIQTLSFGTDRLAQSLGKPRVIERASTLMAQEPMAEEVLDLLKTSRKIVVNVRANSGEVNHQFNFSLKGSNAAISKLLRYCQ